MFGSIGTLNTHGDTFNHATGDQYNTDTPPTSGMVGQMDPQFTGGSFPVPSTRTRPNPKPMFREVDRLNTNDGSFNYSPGAQYNYNGGHPTFSLSSSTPLAIPQAMNAPYVAAWNAPSHNSRSPGTTPSSTGADMFGRINVLQSVNSVYNSTESNQINVRGTRRAAPAVNHPNLHTIENYPICSQAARVTRDILHGIQGSLANEDDFELLAKRACNLVDSIAAERDGLERVGKELAPEVVANLAELVRKLRPIEEFVKGSYPNVDARKVAEHRERFRAALGEFEPPPQAYAY